MAQSSLVTQTHLADPSNYTAGRQDSIHGVVIHHTAGTSASGAWGWFQNPNSNASAHYVVCGSEIILCVPEEYTAWSVGDWAGNSCTISIEIVNSSTGGDWPVSSESLKTAEKLVAEIAKRYGWGKVKFGPDSVYPTLSAHRDWSPTYCPGDYLYSRMEELANKINEINYPTKVDLAWIKLDKPTTYITARNTHLYDFNKANINDLAAIKEYAKDTEIGIYGKVENKTIGKTFLLTEYSFTQKITNGFKDDALTMKPQEAPEPTPAPKPSDEPSEPEKPQEEPTVKPDGTGTADNPRGLSEEEYQELLAEMKAIENNAKEQKVMIPMTNKTYDILKIVAIVILPLIQVLYTGLAKIWGFGFGTEIDQTIQLVIAALNVIIGAALVKSSSDYHKGD